MRKQLAFALLISIHAAATNAESSHFAHLRVVEGDVDVLASPTATPRLGRPDEPIAVGSIVTTRARGRAELVLPDGSIVWLDGVSSVELIELEPPIVLAVDGGTVAISAAPTSIEGNDEPVVRVETPAAVVGAAGRAHLRMSVESDGYTHVACEAGRVELVAEEQLVGLSSGQRTSAYPGEPPESAWIQSAGNDAFDAFVAERLDDGGSIDIYARADNVPATVRPYARTLNAAGQWVYYRDISTWVWQPSVSESWRPYSDGHWTSLPQGLVWVSVAPWGYVTHHYGSWDWALGMGWYWIPGSVYSNAWVDWYDIDGFVAWCPRRSYSYRDHHGRHRDVRRREFDYHTDGHRLVRVERDRVIDHPVGGARVTRPPQRIDRIRAPFDPVADGDNRRDNRRRTAVRRSSGFAGGALRPTVDASTDTPRRAVRPRVHRDTPTTQGAGDSSPRARSIDHERSKSSAWWRRVGDGDRGRVRAHPRPAPSSESADVPTQRERTTTRRDVTRSDSRPGSPRIQELLKRFRQQARSDDDQALSSTESPARPPSVRRSSTSDESSRGRSVSRDHSRSSYAVRRESSRSRSSTSTGASSSGRRTESSRGARSTRSKEDKKSPPK